MKLNSLWRKVCATVAVTALCQATAHAASYVWKSGEVAADFGTPYKTTKPLDEELLVPVSVWGEVRDPGYYDVPDGVNVSALISYAGGPTEYANLTRVRITRPGSGPSPFVDIRRYLETGDETAVPVLKPGDTVYVARNNKYAWREFVKVMSELAVVAGTVLLYVEFAGRDR